MMSECHLQRDRYSAENVRYASVRPPLSQHAYCIEDRRHSQERQWATIVCQRGYVCFNSLAASWTMHCVEGLSSGVLVKEQLCVLGVRTGVHV
ncbi:hypothetical protein FKM82_015463 [Ascaphus truei]